MATISRPVTTAAKWPRQGSTSKKKGNKHDYRTLAVNNGPASFDG